MDNEIRFSCSLCGKQYPVETREFRCGCGGPFELSRVPEPFSISSLQERGRPSGGIENRFQSWMSENIVSLGEGFTPLIPFSYGEFKKILLKLDYLCPTGSYKDRGSTVLISKLKELGITRCIADSSGNAGSSIAAYAARAGIECKIYCPAYTSEGKLVQIKAYGARLVKVPGTRADTAAAVQEEAKKSITPPIIGTPFSQRASRHWPLKSVSRWAGTSLTPSYALQATAAFTSASIRASRNSSDHGRIDKIPRLIGIQSEAVSPVYQAFYRKSKEVEEVPSGTTLAEGIACVKPVRGKKILEIARLTDGCFEIVSEKEIIEGWKDLARQGIYVEPTSAVVIKALDRLSRKGLLNSQESIVLILTGIGLKATDTLGKYVRTEEE